MLCVQNSERITKYVMLILLCLNTAFLATIEKDQRLGDVEDEGIYDKYEDEGNKAEDGDTFHINYFRFTTRKRYIWEDWTFPTLEDRTAPTLKDLTVPTLSPVDHRQKMTVIEVLLFIVIPTIGCLVVFSCVYFCIKLSCQTDCCSVESDSHLLISADGFTAVHQPPAMRTSMSAEVHRKPTERNQLSDSRRVQTMRDLFSELNNIGNVAHATVATPTGSNEYPDSRTIPAMRDLFREVNNIRSTADATGATSRNQYSDSRRVPAMRDLFSELNNIGSTADATGATSRNQYYDSRRVPAMRDLFGELNDIGREYYATGETISFANFIYASSTQGGRREPDNTVEDRPPDYYTATDRREPGNTVADRPPDYYTATLNDLVNPIQPAFPAVKSDKETSPSKYGKGN